MAEDGLRLAKRLERFAELSGARKPERRAAEPHHDPARLVVAAEAIDHAEQAVEARVVRSDVEDPRLDQLGDAGRQIEHGKRRTGARWLTLGSRRGGRARAPFARRQR